MKKFLSFLCVAIFASTVYSVEPEMKQNPKGWVRRNVDKAKRLWFCFRNPKQCSEAEVEKGVHLVKSLGGTAVATVLLGALAAGGGAIYVIEKGEKSIKPNSPEPLNVKPKLPRYEKAKYFYSPVVGEFIKALDTDKWNRYVSLKENKPYFGIKRKLIDNMSFEVPKNDDQSVLKWNIYFEGNPATKATYQGRTAALDNQLYKEIFNAAAFKFVGEDMEINKFEINYTFPDGSTDKFTAMSR